ncbi:MAG: hypothetical protein HQK65_09735, partial [Desulfamplus sp.]|nr:hypothetical protein [Desulfamplus sp.]
EIPENIFNLIPEQWQQGAVKIASKIYLESGCDELRQCIEFVNKSVKEGAEFVSYGGFMRSVYENGYYNSNEQKK